MPTTTTNQPRRAARRVPISAQLDAAVDQAFLIGGMAGAREAAFNQLGWRPSNAQLNIMIGRAAWVLGEARGDQSYMRRMAAAGRDMPHIDPSGVGAEVATDEVDSLPSIERGFGVEIE